MFIYVIYYICSYVVNDYVASLSTLQCNLEFNGKNFDKLNNCRLVKF